MLLLIQIVALPLGDNVSENDWVRLIGKIDHLKYILPKAIAELTEGQEIAATEYNQIAMQFPQIQGYSLDDLLFLYEVYNLDAIVWKSYNCQRITIAFQAQQWPASTVVFGTKRTQQIFKENIQNGIFLIFFKIF